MFLMITATPQDRKPFFSIIIPCYNAEKTLSLCLHAIYSSKFNNFEVLVVDDGSKDNSIAIASDFPCTLVRAEKNQGAAAARNRGAKKGVGEVLLFIDADVVINENTLNLFHKSLQTYPAVFGIYQQKSGVDNLFSNYQNFFAHKSIQETKEHTTMFYTYCAAVKKEIFDAAGGFDESWKRATFEDVEFGLRISAAGHQILLNKAINVTHYNHFNLKRFVNNYFFKSRELSKLMFSSQKLSQSNEGWTNRKNMVSFLTGMLLIPTLLASAVWPGASALFVLTLVFFIGLNVDFYKFIAINKPKSLPAYFLLNVFVQLVSACGITLGMTEVFFKNKGIA
jgi:glycosyltransferase involved in cell wall biosynthesis